MSKCVSFSTENFMPETGRHVAVESLGVMSDRNTDEVNE